MILPARRWKYCAAGPCDRRLFPPSPRCFRRKQPHPFWQSYAWLPGFRPILVRFRGGRRGPRRKDQLADAVDALVGDHARGVGALRGHVPIEAVTEFLFGFGVKGPVE